MQISKHSLQVAAVVCTKEFMTFAHAYGAWYDAQKALNKFQAGCRSFNVVELEDPHGEISRRARKATEYAFTKLKTLDAKFYSSQGIHLMQPVETMSAAIEILEQIEEIIYRADAK